METNSSPHSPQERIFLFYWEILRKLDIKHTVLVILEERNPPYVGLFSWTWQRTPQNLLEERSILGHSFMVEKTWKLKGLVWGAYGLLIYILSDKNHAAESERTVGFTFQRLTLVTHLHSTCLLPQNFHNLPKQGCQPATKSSSTWVSGKHLTLKH